MLIVDGTFLPRPELAGCWDEVCFVDTSFEVAADRAVVRGPPDDRAALARAVAVRDHAAARRYLAEVGPLSSATIVLGNDDVAAPELRRRRFARHARETHTAIVSGTHIG